MKNSRRKRAGAKKPRWRIGDLVRFKSAIRPDYIPRAGDGHGVIVAVGRWSVTVSFFAFPDEPLYLYPNELRRESGTRNLRPLQKQKKKVALARKTTWADWNL